MNAARVGLVLIALVQCANAVKKLDISKCPKCDGRGKSSVLRRKCKTCDGTGKSVQNQIIAAEKKFADAIKAAGDKKAKLCRLQGQLRLKRRYATTQQIEEAVAEVAETQTEVNRLDEEVKSLGAMIQAFQKKYPKIKAMVAARLAALKVALADAKKSYEDAKDAFEKNRSDDTLKQVMIQALRNVTNAHEAINSSDAALQQVTLQALQKADAAATASKRTKSSPSRPPYWSRPVVKKRESTHAGRGVSMSFLEKGFDDELMAARIHDYY